MKALDRFRTQINSWAPRTVFPYLCVTEMTCARDGPQMLGFPQLYEF